MINWKRLSERTSKQLDKDFGVMTDEERDVIAVGLSKHHAGDDGAEFDDAPDSYREAYRADADAILAALTAAGYVLLSPKEAEQERDLERLATAAGMRAWR